jgi:PEGA domain-containing protein
MPGATSSIRTVALATAAALSLPVAACADGLAVLAVAPPPGPGGALEEITDGLRERIAERAPETLRADQLRARVAVPASGPALPELERAYEQARAAYLGGDFERTLAMLGQVAETLQARPSTPGVHELWTKVMLRLARTEHELGRAESARTTLEWLLRAEPDLSPDASLTPAWLAQEIEHGRARLRALPVGTLVVTSSTPTAHLTVDGRDVGTPPLRLELPQGRHHVMGWTETVQVGPLSIDLGPGEREIVLDFAIVEALRPWSGLGLAGTPEGSALLARAGRHLGVDRVVASSLVEDRGSAYAVASLHDVRRARLEREARVRLEGGAVPAGGQEALAEFIVDGHTDSPLVFVPGAPAGAADLSAVPRAPEGMVLPIAGAPGPVVRQTLRWTPVATATATVALAAFAGVQLHSAESAYDRARRYRATVGLATPADVTNYNGYVADGDAAKGKANQLWIGAGACAVATALVGWVGYKRTGEFGPVRF